MTNLFVSSSSHPTFEVNPRFHMKALLTMPNISRNAVWLKLMPWLVPVVSSPKRLFSRLLL
jgi:hypothetical protein